MLEKYSSKNPANRVRLTARFAFSTPAHIVATFFGAGVLRPAPGTWGTLAGALVYALLAGAVPPPAWAAAAAVLFILGVWASGRTAEDLGVADHGGIVVDEVAAIWLVCAFVPQEPLWWAAAFAAFRVFDILKIWPGSWLDRHVKGGFGVMVDDLAAAFYACVFLYMIQLAA